MNITAPTDGQLLRFNATSSKWENITPSAMSINTWTLATATSSTVITQDHTPGGTLLVKNGATMLSTDYDDSDSTKFTLSKALIAADSVMVINLPGLIGKSGSSTNALAKATVVSGAYSILNPFFTPGTGATLTTTSAFSVGTARLYPVFIHRPMTIKPSVYITSAGSSDSHLQLALYTSDPVTGQPADLAHAFADLATAATTGLMSTSDSFVVTAPGVYWVWGLVGGTTAPTLRALFDTSNSWRGMMGLLGVSPAIVTTASGSVAGGTYAYTSAYALNTPPASIVQANLTADATAVKVFWTVTNQQ